MTDDELDALFQQANESMLRTLDEHIDTEARLREILDRAGVRPNLYADGLSPAGEVSDREEPA